ncbi:choline O-acetyltransferase-like isoform X4 [Schistocerca gregaria]|uniref:choline O-acetyltransferase-like isoform X4 n=1 Tax=Schistocerca gregaria TaxID=7010 RepID=UPI00211E8555|nr:choline O-acetyltransferase-like isoform X4 [Schistocerca gregaria]
MTLPKRIFASLDATSGTADVLLPEDLQPLPKLPVPELERTLERYLEALRPLLDEASLERARAAVRAFGAAGGAGPRLQDALLARREALDNWAYEWWLADMYLANPLPLPVNSSPGMVFPPRSFRSAHDQAQFAARFLRCLLDHKDVLDCKALPVERATSREKGQPLCMAQFYRLLGHCRTPGAPRDALHDHAARSHHVAVVCRNQFYAVPVREEPSGARLSERELCAQLMHVLREAPSLPPAPPLGLLTAQRRDVWAAHRHLLLQDEQNRASLEQLESSLLLVCLDEPLPASFNSRTLRESRPEVARGHQVAGRDETNMAHQMLHGGGSALNGANRWFDKTVQVVVSSDGACGLCYEHSPAEGVAVVQLMEQALAGCADLPPAPSEPPCAPPHLPPPRRLLWRPDAALREALQRAGQHLDGLVEDLDFYVYRYAGYGKEFIKSSKVSPDAYIQLALQLAYFKLNRRLVATYESASTRRFRLGRVDCIRSATPEALQWVTAMCQDEDDGTQPSGKREKKKLELFDAAIKKQTEIMVDNILGQGIDIHLLGLREMAKELGEPLPEIFSDESYKIANHFSLSTSQVATATDSFMGYGPVVPDGYGASYNPRSDTITFCLSAFHSCQTTSTWKFAHSLEESLNRMQQLVGNRQ